MQNFVKIQEQDSTRKFTKPENCNKSTENQIHTVKKKTIFLDIVLQSELQYNLLCF